MSWQTTKIDIASFGDLIANFKAQPLKNLRALSPDSLVDLFAEQFGLTDQLDDELRNQLSNIFSLLPQDLRLVGDTDTGSVSLISRINILDVTKQVKNHVSKTEKNVATRKAFVASLNSLESVITDGYVATETSGQTTLDENGNVVKSTTPTAEVKRYVQTGNYLPPQGRYASTQQDNAYGTSSETPLMDTSFPGLQAGLSSSGGETTWEDVLRSNPNSSILDLIGLENVSDSFDVSDFETWMTSGRPAPRKTTNFWGQKITGDNQIAAMSGNKKITWSAKDAVNYIYDLNEKGETQKLKEIQQMLRTSGFFNPETGLPVFGVLDQATVAAWNVFLTDAARSNKSPKDHWLETVNRNKQIRSGQIEIDELQDPLGTAASFQTAAQNVLKRGLSTTEERLLFQKMDEWRREVLTYGLSPQDKPFDFEARINNYLEQKNQNEIWAAGQMSLDGFLDEWFGD